MGLVIFGFWFWHFYTFSRKQEPITIRNTSKLEQIQKQFSFGMMLQQLARKSLFLAPNLQHMTIHKRPWTAVMQNSQGFHFVHGLVTECRWSLATGWICHPKLLWLSEKWLFPYALHNDFSNYLLMLSKMSPGHPWTSVRDTPMVTSITHAYIMRRLMGYAKMKRNTLIFGNTRVKKKYIFLGNCPVLETMSSYNPMRFESLPLGLYSLGPVPNRFSLAYIPVFGNMKCP